MNKAQRVKRLRDLTVQIQLLPKSPERDRLLYEFRSRTVDVDTGVAPREMLPTVETVPPRADRGDPATEVLSLPRPASPATRDPRAAEPFWVTAWVASSRSPTS